MASAKAIILQAAAELLNSGGVDAVTIRSVAEASNYGRTTVTHHFRDKDNLLNELHLVALDAFARHITKSRFSPSFAQDNFEAHAELRGQLRAEDPNDSPVEAGIQIYGRFREECPGYWELLRFRALP